MTYNIAQLDGTDVLTPGGDSRYRFLWTNNGVSVAIIHYDSDGCYTGSRKIGKPSAQVLWNSLVKLGWKRLYADLGGEAPASEDMAFTDYI